MAGSTERVMSWLLTAAAVTIAVAIVRREFFSSRDAQVGPLSLEFDSDWESLLEKGITVGDTSAPIKLIEFVDFECPACRGLYLTFVSDIKSKYGERVSITYVHFPLRIHRFARIAANASECANQEGRFDAFLDVVFTKQDSLGLKSWGSFGKEAGVMDTTRFVQCVFGIRGFERVDSGLAAGRMKRIAGTPVLYVNGWRFSSPPTTEEFVKVADDVANGRKPVPDSR